MKYLAVLVLAFLFAGCFYAPPRNRWPHHPYHHRFWGGDR
jgi:hypothetical protein